jgi:hypothetical protein
MSLPGDVIYLEAVMPGGKVIIGSWVLPDRSLTNFDAQADIGWHIMLCMLDGATEVKVRVDKPKEKEEKT